MASIGSSSSAVKRWPPRAPARAAWVVEQVAGRLEVTGHGPGHHGGVPLGDEQAEVSAGAQHRGDGRQRGGGVVDDLEHAVAEHQVDLPASTSVARSARSPC